MKVLLVNPPLEMLKQEGINIVPPLGILYIGAVLEKAGHQIKIVDCVAENWKNPKVFKKDNEIIRRFDVEENFWSDFFSEFQPDFIGISNLFAVSENICLELADKFKKLLPQTKIVIGGTNASVRAEFFKKHRAIDYVIKGEGEYAMLDLMEGREADDQFHWIKNLDELPFPAYHLLNCVIENYFKGNLILLYIYKRLLPISTSRGCIRQCVFCSGRENLGYWRARSPENVIKELLYLKDKFGIKEINFVDANLCLQKDRFIKLMELMRKNKLNLKWSPSGGIYIESFTPDLVKLMRQTGCHSVYLAIEHGDERMQKYIGKVVPLDKIQLLVKEFRKRGIWTHGNFVLGLPGETKESLKNCWEYIKKAKLDSATFFIGTPLPGSRLYDEMLSGKENIDTETLRIAGKNVWWTEMDADYLRAVVKEFTFKSLWLRIKNELNPLTIFYRFKNFSALSFKMYFRAFRRFFEYLIFR